MSVRNNFNKDTNGVRAGLCVCQMRRYNGKRLSNSGIAGKGEDDQ